MQLQTCDACGASAPATGPIAAGGWVTEKGADCWTKLAFTVYRESKPPSHIQVRPGQAYYGQAYTSFDVCGGCMKKVVALLGIKVSMEVAEQGDFVTIPKEALDALRGAKNADGG